MTTKSNNGFAIAVVDWFIVNLGLGESRMPFVTKLLPASDLQMEMEPEVCEIENEQLFHIFKNNNSKLITHGTPSFHCKTLTLIRSISAIVDALATSAASASAGSIMMANDGSLMSGFFFFLRLISKSWFMRSTNGTKIIIMKIS